MLTPLDLIIYGIGLVLLLLWILFFLTGLKYSKLFVPLEEEEYPFKEIYIVGHAAMRMFRYKYRSAADRKLRKEISVLQGEKYAEYYLRVVHAQKVSIALTIAALGAPLYGLADSAAMMAVVLLLAGLAYYYFGTVTQEKILKRSEELLCDFPSVVSKLALLTNAGMVLREAWEEVAFTGDSVLYTEMKKTVGEMKNGVSEVDAFFNFGSRCMIPEIKKFASTVVQGLVKGNSELSSMLMAQSKEVWAAKKQYVRRQGEKAASKLTIPIMLMFIGILIMVIVPVFSNLGI